MDECDCDENPMPGKGESSYPAANQRYYLQRRPRTVAKKLFASQTSGVPAYPSYTGNSYQNLMVSSAGRRRVADIMNESSPNLVSSSPGSIRQRYSRFLVNETPPSCAFSKSYDSPRNMMEETPPNFLSSPISTGQVGYGYLPDETPPNFASGGFSPVELKYYDDLKLETPPSLLSKSSGYPTNLMDVSSPSFLSDVTKYNEVSWRYSDRRFPSGGSNLFGSSMNSDFLVSGESQGYDSQACPPPNKPFSVSPRKKLNSSPQVHSRNQIALPLVSCPRPEDKIRAIAKKSFSPSSIKEARNNILESIESRLKKEEPLEFNAVLDSVRNYQALRRQAISGVGRVTAPRHVEDVGMYRAFESAVGSAKTSSPGCPIFGHS